ncbi:MAG: A/G-specific adenine glycosylase, partial [Polyangiaceae bacterium]|nr:A/G-specific adenine glycosylase [Polyangiaceae bacterium]
MSDSIRSALLEWFDRAQRDLPWRRTLDPYAIWVSEVMLQQTRVETVIPYYERFLTRFPTPAALAEAEEDAVLAAWSGLGYYRRARMLHAGAREVVATYGGAVPEAREARLALPGVGRYTAGAIGSIAFGKPEPIVDGNVARVLSRVRFIETPPGRADTERRLWDEAERLVYGERPGALNQALMELGATVCTPSSPRCTECPIARACAARSKGAT